MDEAVDLKKDIVDFKLEIFSGLDEIKALVCGESETYKKVKDYYIAREESLKYIEKFGKPLSSFFQLKSDIDEENSQNPEEETDCYTKVFDHPTANYFNIAKQMPFEFTDVLLAAQQLGKTGQYSEKNLAMLGSLAVSSGKPIRQVAGAYSELTAGEQKKAVDSFQKLHISTEDWKAATGRDISENGELQATSEEMMSALPKIILSKVYDDVMRKQSKQNVGNSTNLLSNNFPELTFGATPANGISGLNNVSNGNAGTQNQMPSNLKAEEKTRKNY